MRAPISRQQAIETDLSARTKYVQAAREYEALVFRQGLSRLRLAICNGRPEPDLCQELFEFSLEQTTVRAITDNAIRQLRSRS